MTFREELIKIVLDKLVLAVILAAFGLYLNKLLEQFRTRLSFSTELNRTRVAKIAEIWEKLYEFEEECIESSSQRGADDQKRVLELFDALHRLMQRNRFWIGDSAHEEINVYKVLLRDVTQARANLDESKAATLGQEIPGARRNVTHVRDRLLAGGW